MDGHDELLTDVCEMHEKISGLESLEPSEEVNMLFSELVELCAPWSTIDVTELPEPLQKMRAKLIEMCEEAEGLMESHYSAELGANNTPLVHLHEFPYYTNYIKLGQFEFSILRKHCSKVPTKIAFISSGSLPLTSIVLATMHLKDTTFHNYDKDESANSLARHLVSADANLSERMVFHTADIMSVTDALKDYEVVFLAALVDIERETKIQVIDHFTEYMAPGAILMLRGTNGARAFLHPVVETSVLRGFEVLSVYHPTDEVINSVVTARKKAMPVEE